jgi:predicted dehydrogenase
MTGPTPSDPSRRSFLTSTAAGAAALAFPATAARGANETLNVGLIGVGGRCRALASALVKVPDVRIAAVSDVYGPHLDHGRTIADPKAFASPNYKDLLDRKDLDAVLIATPDHWHTPIAVAACAAGKDVYVEKPLTHNLDEGKTIVEAQDRHRRVVQVGTQQRSEDHNWFLTAVALVREGRIGKVKRVTCAIGGAPSTKKPFPKTNPPEQLNWEMWLGQAPKVDYIKERCHAEFRWWYEYSGGKMTDWGAHHVDIAQWAIGMDESGPTEVEVYSAEHPVALKSGYPTVDDRYNTATAFLVRCLFPNDVEVLIRDDTENGITFEGEKGQFFVSRGRLSGAPVDELKKNPISESVLVALRKGKRLDSHMGNFIECVRDRATPVSDVASHHRSLTTCHLANIAIRLGRNLTWDPVHEQIVGDDEANAWQRREQRKSYEVEA